MSPNLTLEQCPGTYLRNERFDGYCALFEEENVLPGLHLLTAGTLVKITLIKPYLLSKTKVHQKSMDSCFKSKRGHFCAKSAH